MSKPIIVVLAAALGLSACANSSTTPVLSSSAGQTAVLAWAGAVSAVNGYLIAGHASPTVVSAVSKGEAVINAEIAGLSQVAPPKNAQDVVADVDTFIASLPQGLVPAGDAAYVAIAEKFAAAVAALVPGATPPTVAPAPAG